MCFIALCRRIVIFFITFSISLFIVSLLAPKQLPDIKIEKQEEKKCEYVGSEFKKYENFTLEMLETEYLETVMDNQVVIRDENKQNLTWEEREILRRNLVEEKRKENALKIFVLTKLIKFKRGQIEELPFPKNCN